MEELFSVREIIEMYRLAKREGLETDTPEGSRYIKISDTLANRIVTSLEAHLQNLYDDGIDRMGADG